MKLLAIDQSLTCSGCCILRGEDYEVSALSPPNNIIGVPRLQWFYQKFRRLFDEIRPEVVVMEGYSFGSNQSRSHSLGELGGILKLAVSEHTKTHPCTLYIVPPTTLKKFVTGKGNSKKQEMLMHIYKRWSLEFSDDNMADAFALAMIGSLRHYGEMFGSTVSTVPMKESAASLPFEAIICNDVAVRVRGRKVV